MKTLIEILKETQSPLIASKHVPKIFRKFLATTFYKKMYAFNYEFENLSFNTLYNFLKSAIDDKETLQTIEYLYFGINHNLCEIDTIKFVAKNDNIVFSLNIKGTGDWIKIYPQGGISKFNETFRFAKFLTEYGYIEVITEYLKRQCKKFNIQNIADIHSHINMLSDEISVVIDIKRGENVYDIYNDICAVGADLIKDLLPLSTSEYNCVYREKEDTVEITTSKHGLSNLEYEPMI